MTENLNALGESTSLIVNQQYVNELKSKMAPMTEALDHLNTKREIEATPRDVKSVLEALYDEDSSIHKAMEDMVHIGGVMYAMGIHFVAAKDLMTNPDTYADNIVSTESAATAFKCSRNVKGLAKYLDTTCTTAAANEEPPERKRKHSLISELRSCYDPEPSPPKRSVSESDPVVPKDVERETETSNSKRKSHKKAKKSKKNKEK